MNWAAALYAAGIWLLAASAWTTVRGPAPGRGHPHAIFMTVRELLAAALLGLLFGLLI